MATYLLATWEGTRAGTGQVDIVQVFFNNFTNTYGYVARNKATGIGVTAPTTYASYSPDYRGLTSTPICGDVDSIYAGNKYTPINTDTLPFATEFDVEEDSPDCPLSPEPTCDILTTLTRTDETAIGADDGTILAETESSYDGHTYSIDGGSFVAATTTLVGSKYKSSKLYTGLTPKSWFIRCEDSHGCLQEKFITVAKYLDPIIDRPTLAAGANTSRWQAAFNPIVFKFMRIDYDASVAGHTDPDKIMVYLFTLLTDAEIEAALTNPVTVKGTAYDLYQPAIHHQVISGQSVLTFVAVLQPGSPAVFVNTTASKPNYKIEVRITSGTYQISGFWSPDRAGQIRADIAVYLKNLVSPGSPVAPYTIAYREVWDGNEGTFIEDPDTYFATYSAMQLGEYGGGNMAEYVGFAAPNPLAKWLTKMKRPTYWYGLPFTIPFLRDTDAESKSLSLEVKQLDVNGGVLSTVSTVLGAQPAGEYQPALAFVPAVNARAARLRILNTTDGATVTEDITLDVLTPCDNDPYIYLKWINQLGGWDYYRFGHDQNKTLNVGTDTAVERTVFDWQNDGTRWDAVKKSGNEKVQFGAQNITDPTALKWLPLSIKVMLLVGVDKWHTVELIPGSFSLGSTRAKTFTVQFSINLPDFNIQTQ